MQEPIYRFGGYELNPRERVLRWQGDLVPLPPKAVAMLLVLVEAEGRVVAKAELLEAVWPGTFVSEANLPQTISVLRRGLAPGFPDSDPIETVARVGYMFRPPVRVETPATTPAEGAVPVQENPKTISTPAASLAPEMPASAARPRRMVWTGAAMVIALALLASFFWFRHEASGFFSADLKLEPLTAGAAWEANPAVSPDGKWLAYVSREPEEIFYSMWVKPVLGLEGARRVLRQRGAVRHPAWSSDGKTLAFVSAETGGIATLDLATGAVRLVKALSYAQGLTSDPDDDDGIVPAWLPDNRHLVYPETGEDRTALRILDTTTGSTEALTKADAPQGDWNPALSPDGRTVAFLRYRPNVGTEVDAVDLSTRKVTVVSTGWTLASGVTWNPNGLELVTSGVREGKPYLLWRVPLSGAPRFVRISTPAQAEQPSFSPDGRILTFVSHDRTTNLQLVPDLWGTASPRLLYPATQTLVQGQISRDGSRIAFLSDRSGQYEVWLGSLADGGTSSPVQLTHGLNVRNGMAVEWSPDGHTLALAVYKDDFRCMLVDTRTGRFRPLTVPGMEQFGCDVAVFEADERFVYVALTKPNHPSVYRVSTGPVPYAEPVNELAEGAWLIENAPVQFVTGPDGVGLFRGKLGELDRTRMKPIPGLEKVLVASNWSTREDGKVYFLDARSPNPPLQRYDPQTGEIATLTAPLEGIDLARYVSYNAAKHICVYVRFRESAGTQILALIENKKQ